jgi:cytochrome c peroxidase
MDNTPTSNPTTDAGATLGRVLFYDVDLSQNHTISCASCHIQKFSFSDTAQFSEGFNGGYTPRNSMGLIHARFQKDSAFFWDDRAASLEIQTLLPIQNSIEMGLTLDTLVARVSAKSFYPALFQSAFGSASVTTEKISRAIAQFIRSMNTFGSRYRYGVEHTNGNPSIVPFTSFTAQENLGKQLFMDTLRGNCQACHTRNIFVQQGVKNIGLDLVYTDNGVGTAFNNHSKDGMFSVPSLINIELTAPYMHDGRYKTLEQVINFYSDSIKAHPNLSGFLREIIPGTIDPNNNTCDTCAPRKIQYTTEEKSALLAFLKTLTDTIITTDARWSNPFCTSSITGLKELNAILSMSVFPNPLTEHDILNIDINNGQAYTGTITIYDLEGRLAYTKSQYFKLSNQIIRLEDCSLTKGTYLISIESNKNQRMTKKIVIR